MPYSAKTSFLRNLGKFAQQLNDDFEDINHGGCCVIAAHFAKHLKKIFPKTRILVAMATYHDPVDVEEVRAKLESNTVVQWNKNGLHFSHVLLEIEHNGLTYQFDTEDGLVKRQDKAMKIYLIQEGYLTVEEAEVLGEDATAWSDWFDRDQIPAIKKAIDKYFKQNAVVPA